jgi:hypothetical protein
LEFREKVSYSGNDSCLALFRRVVRRRYPSQRWSRSEKCKEIRGKFVSHRDRFVTKRVTGNVFEMQLWKLMIDR